MQEWFEHEDSEEELGRILGKIQRPVAGLLEKALGPEDLSESDGIVLAPEGAGGWAEVSEHDVQRWVAGTVDAGPFAVTWGRGALVVSWRQ